MVHGFAVSFLITMKSLLIGRKGRVGVTGSEGWSERPLPLPSYT